MQCTAKWVDSLGIRHVLFTAGCAILAGATQPTKKKTAMQRQGGVMSLINLTHAAVLVDGLDHPEGVAFGPDAMAYAGGEAGQVYRINVEQRTLEEIASTGSGLNAGLALDKGGNIYVCNVGGQVVNKITPAGAVSVYSAGNRERQLITPNYPAFDSDGYLYVTDSGVWKSDNGCVWSIAPGGAATVITTECRQFPNGCAVSPDGRYLYIAMSLNVPRVVRFPIAGGQKDGPIETVIELPDTVPDGLAFCNDGSLLISCYRPDVIFRYTPDGSLTVVMKDFEGTLLGAPTNICFAGPELSVLLWSNLGRWHIGMNAQTGLRGAPLFYPTLT
jgi:gluconolactonase